MIRRSHVILLALVATAVRAGAQGTPARVNTEALQPAGATPAAVAPDAPATPAAVAADEARGPSVANARAGVQAPLDAVDPLPAPAPRRADTSQNRAFMIVGGAALIVGAVIGGSPGTIVMVGGAVLGLYGLYKFLN